MSDLTRKEEDEIFEHFERYTDLSEEAKQLLALDDRQDRDWLKLFQQQAKRDHNTVLRRGNHVRHAAHQTTPGEPSGSDGDVTGDERHKDNGA